MVSGKSKVLADLGLSKRPLSSDVRPPKSMVFATLVFFGAFLLEQGLLTYCADLSGPV